MDCDLYSSTSAVLENLADRLQVGTIILFDEYFGYHRWQEHEYKAWQECVKKHRIDYEYVGYSEIQVAVRIKSKSA
jgi:hypothetical protein